MKENGFEIGFKIPKVIDLYLSIPFGSSCCERAFSILRQIQPKERHLMQVELMQAMLILKYSDISMFDFTRAVKSWVNANHNLVDSKVGFKASQSQTCRNMMYVDESIKRIRLSTVDDMELDLLNTETCENSDECDIDLDYLDILDETIAQDVDDDLEDDGIEPEAMDVEE